MTEIPSISSYNNEIDLNIIKNSKLFHKFMQNKSGIITNNNNNNTNNNNANNTNDNNNNNENNNNNNDNNNNNKHKFVRI